MKNRMIIFFLFLMVFLAQGCATPARVDKMVISSQDIVQHDKNTPLKENTMVGQVTGGKETNPLWTSQIGNKEFKEALEQSLRAVNLLSNGENTARYLLNANLLRLDQPLIGASLTVTITVQYTLIDNKNKAEIFTEALSTSYTAKFGDSIIAVERLKLANEGAARVNITKLIEKLYELKINTSDVSISG